MLSFAELGIGNAMVFSLYKPLAERDTEKIKSLMKLYAFCYRGVGIVIAVLGLMVVPFPWQYHWRGILCEGKYYTAVFVVLTQQCMFIFLCI